MAILFIPGKFDPTAWQKALLQIDPKLDIRVWPDVGNPADIEFALVWNYPIGELLKYPNLKCISSLGAGVDHIFRDSQRPPHVPIVRVVDPLLIRDMTQYIVWAVLNFTREFPRYQEQQKHKKWQPHAPKNEVNIGILGLGQLGSDAANKLDGLGLRVSTWSRTPKNMTGIKTFFGAEQFNEFLTQTKVLINLLPLTPETENILNRDLFYTLPKGAYIINVARGNHLVEQDLIAALGDDQIAGACLDVFRTEPLPADHPFWRHPKIIISPHNASVTNPRSVAPQILDNYYRALKHEPLLNLVDPKQGY